MLTILTATLGKAMFAWSLNHSTIYHEIENEVDNNTYYTVKASNN